jgi:hypothetical protein
MQQLPQFPSHCAYSGLSPGQITVGNSNEDHSQGGAFNTTPKHKTRDYRSAYRIRNALAFSALRKRNLVFRRARDTLAMTLKPFYR